MSRKSRSPEVARTCTAGLLAWLVPGLGHVYLGLRGRGAIYLATIGMTFWTGVAIGGVQHTIAPRERTAWFMAQSCTGVHNLGAFTWRNRLNNAPQPKPVPHWMSTEIAVVYTGVAGLLNLLVILDAVARSNVTTRPRVTRRGAVPGSGAT